MKHISKTPQIRFPVFCIINTSLFQNSMKYQHSFLFYVIQPFYKVQYAKYDAVVGDN